MDFFVYFTSEYLLQVQERYTHHKRQVRILLSPPLATEKEQPRPHSQTFPQPCLMAISISSSSPSPVSDYIHAPDFALNIYCRYMAEVKFLWFISFFAFFTFLRDRLFFKLWQNPSAVLCQTSTTNTLTGGTSTFTPLLFWSLGVSCRHLADEHMWDLPEMEITWWREVPGMEFTWWNEALCTDSNAGAAAAAAAKLSNLPTP